MPCFDFLHSSTQGLCTVTLATMHTSLYGLSWNIIFPLCVSANTLGLLLDSVLCSIFGILWVIKQYCCMQCCLVCASKCIFMKKQLLYSMTSNLPKCCLSLLPLGTYTAWALHKLPCNINAYSGLSLPYP